MMNAIRRLFRADPGQRPSLPTTDNRQDRRMFPEFDVLIARRAERVNNRSRDQVARYVRVQMILKEGMK
jgi:hypothetical protein